MIAAVLLAMLVVPVAADSQMTTVSYSSDATFTIIYPADGVPLDSGSAEAEAGIVMTTTDPGSQVKLSISSGGDGFVLKHAYDSTHTLAYQVLDGTTELNEGDLIIAADAGISGEQKKTLSFSVDENAILTAAGSYGDTLTFTAEYVTPYVRSAAEAQAAIDNAEPGTTIRLQPGVNYGTLVFGKNAQNQEVDVTSLGGDATGNERYSKYKDITIIGAEGAIVNQITFGIGRETENAIWNYIDVENLVIKDVTFSGTMTAVRIPDGFDIAINGLKLENCKMTSTGGVDTRLVYQPHTGYKTITDKTTGSNVMTSGVKDLTITGCKVTGARQVIEARPMEGITITDNTFKNSAMHDILLAGSGAYYTGILITGNSADSSGDRFVRATSIGSGTVTITGNTITNYLGEDNDYIKVDGFTGTITISGNDATAADSRTLTTTPDQP